MHLILSNLSIRRSPIKHAQNRSNCSGWLSRIDLVFLLYLLCSLTSACSSLLHIHVYAMHAYSFVYIVCFLYCRLALYVYEYLIHTGAQKSAQTFLSEVCALLFCFALCFISVQKFCCVHQGIFSVQFYTECAVVNEFVQLLILESTTSSVFVSKRVVIEQWKFNKFQEDTYTYSWWNLSFSMSGLVWLELCLHCSDGCRHLSVRRRVQFVCQYSSRSPPSVSACACVVAACMQVSIDLKVKVDWTLWVVFAEIWTWKRACGT